MDKSIIIEKISRHFSIPDSEQKLFFEVFLRKCAGTLNPNEQVKIGDTGIIEYRQAQNGPGEDLIAVLTNEGEEFLFEIPEEEKEVNSIDSYFSISIGKPLIPLKGEVDSEFFIPHSGDEIKKMFALKVERFIDDAREQETETDESDLDVSEDVPHVDFSFKNWKSASYSDSEEEETKGELPVEEEIEEQAEDNSVKEIHEQLTEEAEQAEEIPLETVEGQREKSNEEIKEEIPEEHTILEEKSESEGASIESLKTDVIEDESEKETADGDESKTESSKEQITDEKYSEVQSDLNEEIKDEGVPENLAEGDSQTIEEAFKYAKDKSARFESYRKKSFSGFVFAIVILAVVGVVIYLSYYLPGTGETNLQSTTPGEFAVTVERSYEIPVTYPYEKEMLTEAHNAISEELLDKPGNQEPQQTGETVSLNDDIPEGIEIRNPLPAGRVKGYIYKYENMYAVQVSSWKSKSIAISETQKFLDAGYDAFIEKTELTDKGVYYRVRVGGFNSLIEAEKFLK